MVMISQLRKTKEPEAGGEVNNQGKQKKPIQNKYKRHLD